MLREILRNNSQTTLSGSLSNSASSFSVADGSVFPSTGYFRVLIDSELFIVVSRSSNTLTVLRGQEGTTAVSHSSGAAVVLILSEGSLKRYLRDNDPLFGSSRPALGRLVDSSDVVLTSSDFSVVNGTNFTVTDQDGTILLEKPTQTASLDGSLITRTLGSQVIAGFQCCMPTLNSSSGTPSFGLALRQSSTSKFQQIRICSLGGYSPLTASVSQWTNGTTFSADVAPIANLGLVAPVIWLKAVDNGTNISFHVSMDGFNWIQLSSGSRTAFMLTTGPNQAAVFMDNYGNTNSKVLARLVHWSEA